MKNRSRMWEVKGKTTGMWEFSFSKQWEAPCNVIYYHDFLRKIKKSTKLELKAKLEVIEVF